jgi:hypothetical protein
MTQPFVAPPRLKEFFEDFDWRVAKRVGMPPHFLGSGHPVPSWLPLKKPKKDEK